MSLVVLKLGGSLLTNPTLSQRLRWLLHQWCSDKVLIVVGGGSAADIVRDWSRQFDLPEEEAHWVAVRSLSLTRSLVKQLMPEFGEAGTLAEATRHWSSPGSPVLLDVEAFLRHAEENERECLPHTWNVTSDSIAVWAANLWSADNFILLKSTDLHPETDLDTASRQELVDAHFPRIAGRLPRVSWCNLLNELPQVAPWLAFGRVESSIPQF